MKVKVSEASGPVLDWMVAKCEGGTDVTHISPTWTAVTMPAQIRKADYNRDYYDRFVRRTPVRRRVPSAPSAVVAQTKWAGSHQGAQA